MIVFSGVPAHYKKKLSLQPKVGLHKRRLFDFLREKKSMWDAYLTAKRRWFNTKVIESEGARIKDLMGMGACLSCPSAGRNASVVYIALTFAIFFDFESHVCEGCVIKKMD